MLLKGLLVVYIISIVLSLLCNIGTYSYIRMIMLAEDKKKNLSRAKKLSLLNSLVCLLGLSFIPGINTWIGISYLKVTIKSTLVKLLFRLLGDKNN